MEIFQGGFNGRFESLDLLHDNEIMKLFHW